STGSSSVVSAPHRDAVRIPAGGSPASSGRPPSEDSPARCTRLSGSIPRSPASTLRSRMANGGNRPNRPLRPRGGGGAGGRRRRVVIDQGAARPRDQRQARPDAQRREPKPPPAAPPTGPVSVESGVSVRDLSQALGVPMPEIIKILMGLGQMRTATQSLSD